MIGVATDAISLEVSALPSALVDELVALKEQQRRVARPGHWDAWQDLQDRIEVLFADLADHVGTSRATEMIEDQDFGHTTDSSEDVTAPPTRRRLQRQGGTARARRSDTPPGEGRPAMARRDGPRDARDGFRGGEEGVTMAMPSRPAMMTPSVAKILPARTLADYAPGLYENVPPELYYERIRGLASKSSLDYLREAPAVYDAWARGEIGADSAAFFFGRAFHCAVLEPERFDRTYSSMPDFGYLRAHDESGTTKEEAKENKRRRDEWVAAHAGTIPLNEKIMTSLRGMSASLRAHKKASKILERGLSESTLRWTDRETGLSCKARTDWRVPDLNLAVDLKSTADPSESAFVRDAAGYGYDRQSGMYRDALDAVGHGVDHFVFLCVGKTPPYLVGLYTVSPEDELTGREENRRLLGTLAQCLATDTWPGLPDAITEVRLRRWGR